MDCRDINEKEAAPLGGLKTDIFVFNIYPSGFVRFVNFPEVSCPPGKESQGISG
jgi:hypothetical protein